MWLLIDRFAYPLLHFDSVAELHSVDHFAEPLESAKPPPALFGALAQLEDHREHSCAREAALGALGAVAHAGERGLDHVARTDVDPVLSREVVEGKQRLAVFTETLDSLRILGAEGGDELKATRTWARVLAIQISCSALFALDCTDFGR